MNAEHNGHEHELEPQHGLPERLPHDERLLWQGTPDLSAMALRVFHLRKLTIYFVVLLALTAGALASDDSSLAEIAVTIGWLAAGVALASIGSLAWMTARTTVYTLTSKRIVMRIGIVLTVTFNLPLKRIAGADLRSLSGTVGDIALRLREDDHIGWLHLYPHARPWQLKHPEPMLRCLPEAATVAERLAQAWAAINEVELAAAQPAAVSADATTPGRAPALEPAGVGHLRPSLT
jgi:hypothetical protein